MAHRSDAVIRFTVTPTDLGHLLLAATGLGVCGLVLGDDPTPLVDWLGTEFPAANPTRADHALRPWVGAVLDDLAGGNRLHTVPLDVRGTAFQRRVWDVLRTIPRGQTRTYTEVAAALGVPAAVRAVARACATNPASLVIPCHRVVGADGSLRGYRWGVERKRKLLEWERLQTVPA